MTTKTSEPTNRNYSRPERLATTSLASVLTVLLLCLCLGLPAAQAAAPATVWVDDDYTAAGANDGHTWAVDAFATLQGGVDAVADGGTVNIAPGTYKGAKSAKSVNVNGTGPGVVIQGASPAWTQSGGSVSFNGQSFTVATDDPTILVTGGTLTMSNCTVDESTGFDQVAFKVTAGTLVLNSGNTVNINGAGSFVRNEGANPIAATGNTWKQDGTPVTDNFAIEDKVFHALDSSASGLVTWVANNVYVTASSGSVQRGIAAASAGFTVNVGPGTFTESGQIAIAKNLSIIGAGIGSTILKTDTSTTTGGNVPSEAWVYLAPSTSLKLASLTLDGTGYQVHHAVQSRGTLTMVFCEIKNIKYADYLGRGVVLYTGTAGITNVTMSNIERIGVHVRGGVVTPAPAAIIDTLTYTGKGSGTWLDYGVEVGAGGTAEIYNSTITACTGVASDGSTSAGVMATTYYAAGTTAKLIGNTITGNTDGVMVGYDSADTSAVLLQANNLTGNLNAGINMTGGTVDAGQIGGTDITGLGISTGGNNLTGYGPDNAAPWAILNSGTGTIRAFNDNYGTFANVKDLLSGTVAGYSQSGALYLACPPAVTVQCVGGVPAAATDLAGFVAQGGVASASAMTSLGSADVPPTPAVDGTITRTYSLTDVGGNSATCTQTITVHDTTAPTITAPANVTVNVDPGACQATGVALGTPATGDNCAVAGLVNDHPATTFPVGATTVTWTVTDTSGLTATAQQTVTVNDNEVPVVSCKPATVNLDANGQGSISVADVKLSSSDNCGIATETLSQSAFTICDVGTKTVTLTVTDIHGNSAACDATVTVVAPAATPSVAYVDASYGAACAQVTFPAGGGTGQYYVGYNAFNTIQAAVDAVADGGTVHVAPGTYAERVVVAKPNVTVEGAGTTSIVTGTTSLPAAGVTPAVFKVAASGVTISKFKILVDFAFNHSGVHSSGTCTGITVADNLIVASASGTPAFGYGLRNAIAINPNINVVGYTLDNVGYPGVSVTGNTIERSGSTFFRAGIQMDLCAGSIIGNTSTAINHDFVSRFANQGAITVSSNAFYGGGAQVGSFNGGAGAVTIAYNLFDNSIMQPATGSIGTGASLRLIYYAEVPGANNPVTVSGNTFQNHRWAVSVEDYKNVVFDNNSFTPKAGSADYIHMTFNTKIIASTSAGTINMVPVGATLTRNAFNGSGTPGGTALAFYNHRSTDAVFGTYTLGTAGNENTFNAGIARFLQLDASTGASSSWVGFGEYAGVPSTTMAPWPASLDAQNNYFDVGSGPALPSTMSLGDLFAVEDRIQHKLDNAALGLVGLKALNVYVTTSSGSIQRGIDAALAGDTVNVAAGTYTEGPQMVISKNLNVAGQDSATTIIQPAADTGNSGNARGWWLVNSCYTFNLSGVTLDGNGKNVYQGIRNLGNGTISNVHFTGIVYPGYMGTAVAAMGSCGAVNVYDSRFDNIGRVGVIYFGAGTTGAYARNTYMGKGSGDWLDYGVEIGGGGVAAISDSVISACQGIASVDGSTSASILATTYFGSGTSATVNNCILSGNTTGIAVGYDGADTSAVVARNNDLSGNSSAGVSTTGPAVDAQNNWWGSPQGPTIAANAGGNGVATEAGVDFSPWLGLGTDTSASIGFQPNPAPIYYTPHHLVFSTQPGGASAASLLAPQPVVQVIDENGGIAAQFGGNVSLAIGNNPSGGTLAGTLTLPAAAGVATFSGLSIDRAGAAYTLAASSLAPIAGATSAAFDTSNPLPGIVSLTPPWAVAGDPAFTLTVNGSSFVYDSVVRWNGADRATTYISPTQLSIAVAAADIASAATANVTVFNTAPGGGESAPVAFEVRGVPSVVWVDDNYTSGGPNDGHLWGYDAFDKIQDGVNRVAASGTVNVGAGTYIENITIPKSLHLLGAGTGTVIYPAQLDVGQPNPDDGPSFRASQVIVVAANNVEIGRLTIDGDNPSNGAGVDARNGIIEGDPAPFSGLEVHHCVVKNIYLRAIYPRSAAASNGFYIHDNTVDNVQGGPSSVAIFNFGGSGIFSNNVVTAANDAISANHSAGTLFLNNRITNCASGVHTDNAGDGGGTADAIRGNIVVDETGAALSYGIWVFVPYLAPTVETNTVIGCGAGLSAFGQGAPVATVFKNNLVDGQSLAAGTWGVYVSSSSFGWGDYNVAASFTGNFIRNNLVGCYIDAAAGKTLDLTAFNNSLEGNTTAIQASAGTGTLNVNASGNWWGTTSDTTIAGLMPGTVDFTPYLHTGTDLGGNSADGFQGDFSALHVSALGSQTGSSGRIQEGIDLASAGSLYVQAGTYVEAAQVLVNKDLSIIGAAAATTIIKPAADTGASDDSKGWFLVGDGKTVSFQQATFDGTGRKVYQAIRHKGTGAIADCVFANIQYEASGPAYQGTAIGIHTTGNVDVTGCSFSGIGRNGVAAYDTYLDLPPTGPTGTYSGNTYTGKGAGNWLDYAFLLQGGAHVNINNNQVSDCIGVATVDGSGSSGIAIWDDPGTAAALAGNTLANNSVGLAVAIWYGGGSDPQVTVGAGNTFIGGDVGVELQNVGGVLAASPAVTIGASTFQGQTLQAIGLQDGISAGSTFDISAAAFKTAGGVTITDNFDKEDAVHHVLDAPDQALLVWNANNVYVTPLSASIQRGVDAASAGWTVNVKAGAYTENVNVNKPAAVSLGASPAQVTLNGNLALSAGSSLVFELNGLTPGADYDQLIVNGTVDLGGATLTTTSGFSFPAGSTVVLIANDGTDPVAGTFAGLANGATLNIGGQDFTIYYNGGDGNDVVLFRSGGLGTFATVYVNNNFANPAPGQDPDGAGPAHYYLYDSFPTIQQGVNAVQAGGSVQVAAGTYSESQVLIAQPCIVQGQGAATTIIDAGCGTGLSAPGTVRITAPGNVTFDGFTVKNPKAESVSGKNTRVGIFASSPTAGDVYTIEHNIILGCNNPADTEDYGFYAQGGLGTVLFRTNEIHLVSANPILIERHPGATEVSYNTFDRGVGNFSNDAYFNMNYGGATVSSLQKVHHNTIDMGNDAGPFDNDHRGMGITFAGAFNGTEAGGYSQVVITENQITNLKAYRRGIGLWNNAPDGNAAWGDITGAVIERNTLSGPATVEAGSIGVRLLGQISAAGIRNNLISGVGTGIQARNWNTSVASDTVIFNNSFASSTIGLENQGGTALDASGNWWGANTEAGVASSLVGPADCTPWLDIGADLGAAAGFQGDFSFLHVSAACLQTAGGRIQEAINLLADGALTGSDRKVDVLAGYYLENVVVNKAASVLGPNAGVPATGTRATEAVVRSAINDPDGNQPIISIEHSNVRIAGLKLDGASGLTGGQRVGSVDVNGGVGIQNGNYASLVDVDNVTIENNIFRNHTYQGVYIWNTYGLNSSGNYIRNNSFDNMWEGVQLYAMHARITDNLFGNVRRGLSVHQVNTAPDAGFEPIIAGNTVNVAGNLNVYTDGGTYGTGIWVNGRKQDAPALVVSGNTVNAPNPMPTGKIFVGLRIWDVEDAAQLTFQNNQVNGNGAGQIGVNAWLVTGTQPPVITGGAISGVTVAGAEAQTYDADPDWGGHHDVALIVDAVPMTLSAEAVGVRAVVDPADPAKKAVITVRNNTAITGGTAGVQVSGANVSAKIIDNPASITGNTVGVDVDAGKAMLQNNNLAGNTLAAIRASNGAIVDAGQCGTGGTDVTGLGISSGGNVLSGYGFDGAVPWAILNLNSGTPSVLACNDDFGAAAGQSIAQVVSGNVFYTQAGSLLASITPAVTVQCLGDVPGGATTEAGFLAAGGVASASPVSVSFADGSLTPGPIEGTITRTYTITDGCGTAATCSQTITVNDTTFPLITAPAPVTLPADPGACGATSVALGTPVSSDNCGLAGVSNNAPGTFPVGTTTVTWTATDLHGNQSTATQTVTVQDTQPPTLASPANIVQAVDAGQTYATVAFTLPAATDNCGIASVVSDPASPHQFSIGTNVVSVVATDVHGNTSGATFTVAVIALPSITTQPVSRTNYAGSTATFTVAATSPAPLSYQWKKGGAPLSDGGNISGATTASLSIANVSDADAGLYTVEVSNLAGSVTSDAATLTVFNPPIIASQPQARTNNASTTASFTVVLAANSTPPLAYQWFKNGTNALADAGNVSGATTGTLTLANVLAADAGEYSVTISNEVGTVTSTNALLTVIDPVILEQPMDVVAPLGSPVSFTVTAAGTAPLSYQWYQSGVELPGETAATLALGAIVDSDEGFYSVVVSNSIGTVASIPAALLITHPPVITVQPASQIANQGDTVIFDVSANGTVPFSYQWSKGGVPLPGETSRQLVLAGVAPASEGSYQVTITNVDGAATSAAATLTVIVPPVITLEPVGLTTNAGAAAVFSVTVAGSPAAYSWFKNGTNLLSDGGKISGATSNILTLTDVLGADGGQYSFVASNRAGIALSSNAVLAVIDPIITAQPVGLTVNLGDRATLTVAAYGTAPAYQWRLNGAPINGATSATLLIASASAADAGHYDVVVSNQFRTVTSDLVVLAVIIPPHITVGPASLTRNAGQTAVFTVTVEGTAPFTYQWKKAGVDIEGATTDTLTLTGVSQADATTYTVYVSNPAGKDLSDPATLTVIDPPVIIAQPQSRTNNATTVASFAVTATGTAPAYQWLMNGTNLLVDGGHISGAASAVLTLSNVLAADRGGYSVVLSNAAGAVTSSIAALFVVDPAIFTQPVSQTNVTGGSATFTVTAAGTPLLSYQWYQGATALFGRTASSLTLSNLSSSDAGNYTVVVTGPGGSITSAPAYLATFPPLIVTQPVSQTVNQGQPASFSVSVNGLTPFTYQWQRAAGGGNWTNVASATNRIYSVASAQASDAGDYRVVVTNPVGSETSQPATLTVIIPPTIATQPASQTNVVGSTVTFTVGVDGSAPFAYQWKKGAADIANQTNATLVLAGITAGDAGTYSVVVTNPAGTATSLGASLTVVAQPALTILSCTNGKATLSLTATAGYRYGIQATTNFVDWTSLVTNVAPYTFIDTNAGSFSQRYYRGFLVP